MSAKEKPDLYVDKFASEFETGEFISADQFRATMLREEHERTQVTEVPTRKDSLRVWWEYLVAKHG